MGKEHWTGFQLQRLEMTYDDVILSNWLMINDRQPKIYRDIELKKLCSNEFPDIPYRDLIDNLRFKGIVEQTVRNEYKLTKKGLVARSKFPILYSLNNPHVDNTIKTNPEEWVWFRKLCNYYRQCTEYDEQNDQYLYIDEKCNQRTVQEGSSIYMIPKAMPYEWLRLPEKGTSKEIELSYTKDSSYAAGMFMADNDESEIFIGYPIVGHVIRKKRPNDKFDVFYTPVCQIPAEVINDGSSRNNKLKLKLDFKRAFLNPMWIEKSIPFDNKGIVDKLEEICYEEVADSPIPVVNLKKLLPLVLEQSYHIESIDKFDMVSLDQINPKMKKSCNHKLFNTAVVFQSEALHYSKVLKKELNYIANEATDEELDRTALAYLFRAHPFHEENGYRTSVPFIDTNQEQSEAVELAMNSHVAVVQGPPGTGKTQMAVNLIANSVFSGESVLFTSNNHQALNAIRDRADNLFKDIPLVQFVSSFDDPNQVSWFNVDLKQFNNDILCNRLTSSDSDINITHSLEMISKLKEKYEVWNDFYSEYLAFENKVEENIKRCLFSLQKEYKPDVLSILEDLFSKEASLLKDKYSFLDRILFRTKKLKKERAENIEWMSREFPNLYKETLSEFSYDIDKLRSSIDDAKRFYNLAINAKEELNAKYSEMLNLPNWEKGFKEYVADYENLKSNCAEAFTFRYYNRAGTGYSDSELNAISIKQRVLGVKGDRGLKRAKEHSAKLRHQQSDDDYCGEIERVKDIYHLVPAWAVTLLSLSRAYPCVPGIVDQAIVDESSQCLPATLIPVLFRAKRVVVVGDENQLQPITSIKKKTHQMILKYNRMSDEDENLYYLGHSAYDIAKYNRDKKYSIMLKEHFRCSPEIANFINHNVYNNQMRIRSHKSSQFSHALEWIDVKDNLNGEIVEAGNRVRELIQNGYEGSIGIITPLSSIAQSIEEYLVNNKLYERVNRCSTVYSFQGGEEDVIILVLGLNSETKRGQRWYIEESGKNSENLLNVAISRAKKLLLVIGDKEEASQSESRIIRGLASYDPKNFIKHLPVCESPYEQMLVDELDRHGIEYKIQYPVNGRYLDIAIFTENSKIDIEVDGITYHTDKNGRRKMDDIIRDEEIMVRGYLILRFWSKELDDYMEECIERIKDTMKYGTVQDAYEWRANLKSSAPSKANRSRKRSC